MPLSHGASGKTDSSETTAVFLSSSASLVCIFKFVVFFLCVINNSSLWGEDPQATCCPLQPHSFWEDSALWSLLGASLLDGVREEPGPTVPWTCSPAQKGNTHEPRALLTLLSPGVQMRRTSLKKAGLGFQKPNFF